MSVFAFPIRPAPLATATLATAVDRYPDSIPAATTRAGYDDTLARLIDVAGGASPVADLAPPPARAPGWTSCSTMTRTHWASECCGGCCARPPPAPRRSSR